MHALAHSTLLCYTAAASQRCANAREAVQDGETPSQKGQRYPLFEPPVPGSVWLISDCYLRCFVALSYAHSGRVSVSNLHSNFHSNDGFNCLRNATANRDPGPIGNIDRRSDPDEHAHGYASTNRDANVHSFSDCDVNADPHTISGAHRDLPTRQAGCLL